MGSNNAYWFHCCIILLYKPKLNIVQMKCKERPYISSVNCSLLSVTFNTLLRRWEAPGIACFYINLIPREG